MYLNWINKKGLSFNPDSIIIFLCINDFHSISWGDSVYEKSTKFDNLKKKELQYGFSEHLHSNFFRVGQQKQWEKILNQKQIEAIEKKFKNQLTELNYI